ncbi:uncharacterized protein LOC116295117 isoform X2 [Actinia tenebrosa]|nr:uncharacterized protein LOC116295117 isoform X2 [Actinia tenebrosa]XP_031558732.1 uncharacterized protein LOC116295117 isoform X2 [Actinia tenebrosa]XP_031558740.1 uncharacterized protein LOC116295117 isoform X2 [Actinia tenebrosa]XP_031558748.1 uncharacterized protein LOC116295117 isoform X2 [Actinia tenebrosa]
MSYYLGRSDYSSYRSSYEPRKYSSLSKSSYGSGSYGSSYSRPSYADSYSWRNSSSLSSSYKPKTYDIGSSSFSSSYGSRYGDSSWRTRDLTNRDSSSKDYSSTTEDSKDYLSNDGNSTEESSSKDDTATEEYSAKTGKDALAKDFSEQNHSSNGSDMAKEEARESFVKEFFDKDNSDQESPSKTKGPLFKDFSSTGSSGRNLSSRRSENTSPKETKDFLGKYGSDSKQKNYLNKYLKEDDKGKITNGEVKDFSQTNDASSYEKDKYGRYGFLNSTKNSGHRDRNDYTLDDKTAKEERKFTPNKKVYSFEDVIKEDTKDNALFASRGSDFDDVDSYKPKQSGRINGDSHGSLYKPKKSYFNQKNKNSRDSSQENRYSAPQKSNEDVSYSHPKMRGRASSDSGPRPVSLHRPEIQKFISVVPEENRYITSVNYLPDRIELRLCGTTPKEKKIKKWRSIPDLYNITLKPQQSGEEQISCEEEAVAYAYDSSNELLNYSMPKHEHMKEMYVTQYTHHFDPEEPRSHIAGWKVDVEPNGIPHERSRMCVLKHPVVSGPNKHRRTRPKSAPPMIPLRSKSPEEPIRLQQVDVVDRGYYTSPRSSRASESGFYNGIEDSTDVSSLGYAPSDDTSDSSAFLDPRSPNNKDSNFSFSKPKLIRLSAEFPGIRNLEKMRRKRQSMGSATSPRPRSSLGHSPSSRDGEYGFFVALTSGDSPKFQSKSGRSYSHY